METPFRSSARRTPLAMASEAMNSAVGGVCHASSARVITSKPAVEFMALSST